MNQQRTKLDLEHEVHESMKIPTIRLAGNLDIYTAQELRRVLEKYLEILENKTVLVDVENLEYIDSSGIGVLFAAAIRLKKRGGQLFLVRPQEMVQMALLITKALVHMAVCESIDDACIKIEESKVGAS